jgi:hypothetical protein
VSGETWEENGMVKKEKPKRDPTTTVSLGGRHLKLLHELVELVRRWRGDAGSPWTYCPVGPTHVVRLALVVLAAAGRAKTIGEVMKAFPSGARPSQILGDRENL